MIKIGKKIMFSSNLNEPYQFLIQLVDCVWGEWNIGVCSNECGGGHQINIREKIQEELFGGKPCEGEASVEEDCNMHNCPGKENSIAIHFLYH